MNAPTHTVQVPLLGRGRHTHPRAGGCLMELVGATVGGPWTDRPSCTPPVLALIARIVNDHTSPEARPLLAPLIPYLVSDTDRRDHLHADLAVGGTILAAASTTASASADLITSLDQHLHQLAADAALPSRRIPRLTPRRHHHQFLAITNLALRAIYDTAETATRNEQLRTLLVAAINAKRDLEGLPLINPAPDWCPSPEDTTVTVLTRLVMPPGADWHELEVTLDPEHCPSWLSDPWQTRQAELALHHMLD